MGTSMEFYRTPLRLVQRLYNMSMSFCCPGQANTLPGSTQQWRDLRGIKPTSDLRTNKNRSPDMQEQTLKPGKKKELYLYSLTHIPQTVSTQATAAFQTMAVARNVYGKWCLNPFPSKYPGVATSRFFPRKLPTWYKSPSARNPS